MDDPGRRFFGAYEFAASDPLPESVRTALRMRKSRHARHSLLGLLIIPVGVALAYSLRQFMSGATSIAFWIGFLAVFTGVALAILNAANYRLTTSLLKRKLWRYELTDLARDEVSAQQSSSRLPQGARVASTIWLFSDSRILAKVENDTTPAQRFVRFSDQPIEVTSELNGVIFSEK